MKPILLGTVLALVGLVQSQDGLPTCAQTCVTKFTSGSQIGSCGSYDIHCICSSSTFLNGIACCLASACDAADQAAAVTYAKQICMTAGVTVPDAVVCVSSSTVVTSTSTSPSSASSAASSTASSTTVSTTASTVVSTTTSAISSTTSSAGSSTGAASVSTTSSSLPTVSTPTSATASATHNAGTQNVAGAGISFIGGFAALIALL